MNVKTFLISLEGQQERRKLLEKDLKRLHLNYEVFNAINGYALSDLEIEKLCDVDAIKKNKSWYTKGMIGCTLSHYHLYKRIINDNLPYAFIIEDDARLPSNIKELLERAITKISSNEVVLFYYQSIGGPCNLSTINTQPLTDKYKLLYPVSSTNFNTTGAYLITRDACLALEKIILPVRVGPDDWNYFLHNGLKSIRLVYPRPVKTYDFRSTISNTTNFSGGLLASMINLIDKHKIFPLYNVLAYRRSINKNRKRNKFFLIKQKSELDTSTGLG